MLLFSLLFPSFLLVALSFFGNFLFGILYTHTHTHIHTNAQKLGVKNSRIKVKFPLCFL